MITVVVIVVAGLTIALGASLNAISKLTWEKQCMEAHVRELERQMEQIQESIDAKQSFAEFNLIVEESA